MCGACGGGPPDRYGPEVAGPRRRRAVARAVEAVCDGLRIRSMVGGWTVATRTGRTSVCRTLDELVRTVEPHSPEGYDRLVSIAIGR